MDSREKLVQESVHSIEMEGGHVSAQARHDAQLYAAGALDADEFVRRTRHRYGLDA
ncbi:antitoxin VbhA family protein [Bifidobacterium xylocopae]|uniref:antitoxin VbhA family protein n=1 Tax=Bifidobacterium xylocopae TaxID=2493119 RepID=UPI00137533FD|nr:antitoxin VbhA family protein [Bifidobacterium xylocopae]